LPLSVDKFTIDRDRGIIYVNGDLNVEGRVPSFILVVSAENDLATGAAPDTVSGSTCYNSYMCELFKKLTV